MISNFRFLQRKAVFFLICALFPHAAVSQESDSVTAMCLERNAESVCRCTSAAVLESLGKEDYKLYDRIGTAYLKNLETGQSLGDAWTAALEPVAGELGIGVTELMARTNKFGKLHAAAIKACQG